MATIAVDFLKDLKDEIDFHLFYLVIAQTRKHICEQAKWILDR